MTRGIVCTKGEKERPQGDVIGRSPSPRFPFHVAGRISTELLYALREACETGYCTVAGSLRRLKPDVGDIEIVYVPRFGETKGDGLFPSTGNLVDAILDRWLRDGTITKRTNVNGSSMWGKENKYAVHAASGIPVDFFATSKNSWLNYLVCRTGGKQSNQEICIASQRKGWQWHPYHSGFTDEAGNPVLVKSEADVFSLVGLPYKQPWERT